ncbi:MAG: MATE family efflux transporter [Pseudomonadales bacterium]|nr:MATE family efflux transporter [Pseudomonadales bacterium]
MQPISRRHVLHIAWPIILSNLSTPLLGIVDTAVIGNLGNTAYIGAIAIGAMIFSFIYWGFGFLRMGTTGLVAQAIGANNQNEVKAALYRAIGLGVLIGLALVVLQNPISHLAFNLVSGSPEVETAALKYFEIRIWAAPVSLAHLAIMGFLLAKQDSRSLLFIQLILNGTNIILDLVFVVGLGWEITGVAVATIISEVIAIIVGIVIVMGSIGYSYKQLSIPWFTLLNTAALKHMLIVNRDIMIRTLCLLFAFAWFTNQGAQAGDLVLSANALLMQLVSFAAFFLDGFALAGESLVGQAVGAADKNQLIRSIRYCFELAAGTSLVLSMLFWLLGNPIIHLMTNIELVQQTAQQYLIWAIIAPPISFCCYLLDGIFIGATCTREMRNAMLFSLLAFLCSWYFLHASWDNHGLWLSLHIYFLSRAASLGYYLPRIINMPVFTTNSSRSTIEQSGP